MHHSILCKIREHIWVFRSLPKTIYFNFKVLPFSQAIRIPIWLYKPKFGNLTGQFILDIPEYKIRPGIICLGKNKVNIYPNSGCLIDNRGVISFKGSCFIGNNSSISVGEKGRLEFGEDFNCTTSIKLVCYHSIVFGKHVLVGWDCLFLDTDFHSLKRNDGSKTKGYAPIIIGDDVWFGCECRVFKRTTVPSRCVISAQTILSEALEAPECSIIGNTRSIIYKTEGYYRDFKDDIIDY